MLDFKDAREKMVQEQLIKRGIHDERILNAFRKVERHLFVSNNDQLKAYEDNPVSIACGQTISQPYMVALMTQLLALNGSESILEIGTGSGYQTAILAELAQKVYSIERHPELADQAQLLLVDLAYTNFQIKIGNGTIGWPEFAPFDSIIVTAGAPEIPDELISQLKEKGKLIIPVGSSHQQELLVASKRSDSYITNKICNCVFVPLIGEKGWNM